MKILIAIPSSAVFSNLRETPSSIRGTAEPSVGYTFSLIPLRFSLFPSVKFSSAWKEPRIWLGLRCARNSLFAAEGRVNT